MTHQRIILLGGYGVFGGRLARLLARQPNLDLVIAGRRADAARAFCRDVDARAPGTILTPKTIANVTALREELSRTPAVILVNCIGPYQGQDYALAEAAIDARAHYVDLSDGRAFVSGFEVLNARTRSAGVLAVTGASTLPGLSSVVVDTLSRDFASLESIEMAIAPGMRMDRGDAVVRAILGYVGKPFQVWRNEEWQSVYGWQDVRSRRLQAAGRDTGRRWLGACDVPDLELFPKRYPSVRTVTFHAGLEVTWVHFGLWMLSWAVRARLVNSLTPLSKVTRYLASALSPFGTGRGGMVIDTVGMTETGARVRRQWTIIADNGEGPWIPVLPTLLVIQGLLAGTIRATGARPCVDLFTLGAFEALSRRFDIVTDWCEIVPDQS